MIPLLALALAASAPVHAPAPTPQKVEKVAPKHDDTDFSDVKPRPQGLTLTKLSPHAIYVDAFGQIQDLA